MPRIGPQGRHLPTRVAPWRGAHMKRLIILAVIVMAAAGMLPTGFDEWTPPAHATTPLPTKIAVIEFENEKSTNIVGSNNADFINDVIATDPETIAMGQLEGTASHTNPTGSAEEYTYQTSADNCGGASVDSWWNTGGTHTPLASGTGASACGESLFNQLTDAGKSWTAYNEFFTVGTTTCTDPYSQTGSPHNEYARKHNP